MLGRLEIMHMNPQKLFKKCIYHYFYWVVSPLKVEIEVIQF